LDEIFLIVSLITPSFGIFQKKRQQHLRSRRPPPFSAATKKFFLLHFSPN
jgi:hypothetical protein